MMIALIPATTLPAVERAFLADRLKDNVHPANTVKCFKTGICVSTTTDGGRFIFRAHKVKYPCSRAGWKFQPIGGVL